MLSLLPSRFAVATTSAMVRAGKEGWASRATGIEAINPTGAKSRRGSKVKAALSGDENDYILNYKARYPLFPHESTGDQFFSEEQFEVYRSLGFHSAFSLFKAGTCARPDAATFPRVERDFQLLQQLAEGDQVAA